MRAFVVPMRMAPPSRDILPAEAPSFLAAYDALACAGGDPEWVPRALVNLGVLLAEQGDAAGARAAYQRVIDSDHPDMAPMSTRLVELLDEQ